MFFNDIIGSTTGKWVNAYFDTPNGLLECKDPSNNCENKIKFYDGSIWNLLPDMTVDFRSGGNKKCLKFYRSEFVALKCTTVRRMVCLLTCCKLDFSMFMCMKFTNFFF